MSSKESGGGGAGRGKAPSQAGRFKPRKPVTRKPTAARAPAATSGDGAGRGRGRGRRQGGRSSNAAASSGRGGRNAGRAGRGGRSARGGGRGGRGRGRFSAPKGQVFFTGSATTSGDGDKSKISGFGSTGLQGQANDEVILMPGMGSAAVSRGAKGSTRVGGSAQERLAASALARRGEGEEVIVGELEEGMGIGDGRAKNQLLRETAAERMGPSKFDNDDDEQIELSVAEFTYDSDSSADGETKRNAFLLSQRRRRDGRTNAILQPQRLPFPPPRKPGSEDVQYLYKDQLPVDDNDDNGNKKEEKGDEIMTDPPLEAPFLNLSEATPDQQKEEQTSWMIFKLPTRLPRLAPQSTLSGRVMKSEDGGIADMDVDMDLSGVEPGDIPMPDVVTSLTPPAPTATSGTTSGSGYDDTLKDAAPGRYGKIVVHKSGKAYLIVGGEDPQTPQVRMLLSSGLPCGFLQQAVAIDTNQASYIPLGEVKKTLVATPDVESAFKM